MKAKVFRRWLNKSGYHSTAIILGEVEYAEPKKNGYPRQPNISANLAITDCYKKIELDLSGSSPKKRKNAIYKLDQIIEVATDMRQEYVKLDKKANRWLKKNT